MSQNINYINTNSMILISVLKQFQHENQAKKIQRIQILDIIIDFVKHN